MKETESEDPRADIRNQAFRLLARREYSYREMQQRFERSFEEADVVAVLDALVADGYQSDRRFCEVFVRSRIAQYQGASRIRYEMRQKGIGDELVAEVIEEEAPDWYEQAREARLRRFPAPDRSDRKLVAKVMRYLLQRGFSMDEARYALEAQEDESEPW